MNKLALITDSSCDISQEFIQKHNIKIIPLRVCFSDKTFLDRVELTSLELYDKMKTEIPKTSLPSSESVMSVLDELKNDGFSDVLYVGVSSGLSGTYNFVKLIGEQYDGLNFYSFDTKTLSCGQGLLVKAAARMIEKECPVEDILSELQNIRNNMMAMFIVKDLTYLKKGGRIGKVAGTIGSLLKICPIVRVNDDGVYESSTKSLGFSRSLQMMIKEFENKFKGHNIIVSVVHGLEEGLANSVLNKIKQFANVIDGDVIPVTAVLAVHTGPGLIGIIAHNA